MARLDPELVKSISGHYDLECVRRLDLSNRQLTSAECLEQCANIEVLKLSQNNLSNVSFLAKLSCLRVLDLSSNNLTSLCGLGGNGVELTSLQSLDVSENEITDLDETARIIQGLPSLKSLTMMRQHTSLETGNKRDAGGQSRNPCCNHPAYLQVMLRALPGLLSLDGERLCLRASTADMLVNQEKERMEEEAKENYECQGEGPTAGKSWLEDLTDFSSLSRGDSGGDGSNRSESSSAERGERKGRQRPSSKKKKKKIGGSGSSLNDETQSVLSADFDPKQYVEAVTKESVGPVEQELHRCRDVVEEADKILQDAGVAPSSSSSSTSSTITKKKNTSSITDGSRKKGRR